MGKLSKGIKDIYKFYKIRCKSKNVKQQNLEFCAKIWEECNLRIRDVLLKESDVFKLPVRGGNLRVRKKKIDYSKVPDNKFKIDYGTTMKLGHTVYYTNDYIYKVIWEKNHTKLPNKSFYFFKACKHLNRELAKCIKVDKIDYFE